MSGIIEGYNYDIFISYRQKDNKGDRWVSEFVEALKTELDSTFKEDISIYFDENPHDGLLETHDVDASLKEKMKCLIFIPIISRTYCDPKAFAWEHELLAFINLASTDRFGLKVTLPYGNVGTRVLPIRIHELSPEDTELCETALGGVLRGVDFIYKAPGVNRPLLHNEDHPKDNLNKTYYRDQINKVANAIDEIIRGIKNDRSVSKQLHQAQKSQELKRKRFFWENFPALSGKVNKRKFIIVLVAICCLFSAYILYKSQFLIRKENSFAFLRLTNLNNDSSLVNDAANFMELVNEKVGMIGGIIRKAIFIDKYGDSMIPVDDVIRRIRPGYILEGNIRKDGQEIKIYIELTNVRKKKVEYSKPIVYERSKASVLAVETVLAIADRMGVPLPAEEIRLIKMEPSSDPEINFIYTSANKVLKDAWEYYNYREKLFDSISFNKAIESYNKILERDTAFALAYAKRSIARSWGIYLEQLDSSNIEKCRYDIDRAKEINGNFPECEIAEGFYYYYCLEQYDSALYHFGRALEMDPGNKLPEFYISLVYRRLGDWEKCRYYNREAVIDDPSEALFLTNIGMTFMLLHNLDSALIFHQRAIDAMPAWASSYKNKFEGLIMKYGITSESESLVEDAIQKTGDNMKRYRVLIAMYRKKYESAIQLTRSASSKDFNFVGEKYLLLGRLYDAQNNRALAMKCYDSARIELTNQISSFPKNYANHGALGLAYAGLGNKTGAMEEIQKAIKATSLQNRMDETDMRIYQAQIFTLLGDYDNAFITITYLLNNPSFFSKELLLLDPVWKPLSDQPRYRSKIKKI